MKTESFNEIVREKKRALYETNSHGVLPNLIFHWGKDGYKQLRNMVAATIACPHGLNCLACDYGDRVVGDYLKNQPLRFLGVDHYWDEKTEGMCLKIEEIYADRNPKT